MCGVLWVHVALGNLEAVLHPGDIARQMIFRQVATCFVLAIGRLCGKMGLEGVKQHFQEATPVGGVDLDRPSAVTPCWFTISHACGLHRPRLVSEADCLAHVATHSAILPLERAVARGRESSCALSHPRDAIYTSVTSDTCPGAFVPPSWPHPGDGI